MDKSLNPIPSQPLTKHRQIDSKTLLGDEECLVIIHGDKRYLLRQTQAGKLILTK